MSLCVRRDRDSSRCCRGYCLVGVFFLGDMQFKRTRASVRGVVVVVALEPRQCCFRRRWFGSGSPFLRRVSQSAPRKCVATHVVRQDATKTAQWKHYNKPSLRFGRRPQATWRKVERGTGVASPPERLV